MSKTIAKKIGQKSGPVRRKTVSASQRDWVKTELMFEDRAIPLVIRPAMEGVDLIDWARNNRDYIEELYTEHRALLFRGFQVPDVSAFHAFSMAASNGQMLEYKDRTTPRTSKKEGVYTSTIHPADQRINLHNEGTYWLAWAQRIFFGSLVVPDEGGATPIADVRNVYKHIDPEIRDKFIEKKWALVRNYNDGFGLPWQEVYQTEDKAEVEEYCTANDIDFEWKDSGRLRTQSIRPAVRIHPETGEPLWFNHIAFFHYTTLDSKVQESLLAEFGVEGLPYNTCYGDGTQIEPDVAEHLRQAYQKEYVAFLWEKGDVTLLDNMAIAHAREPYKGDREVVVCMTDAISGSDLADETSLHS